MKIIDWGFDHQQQVGLICLLAAVIYCLAARKRAKQPMSERVAYPLIGAAFAGYAVPQGMFLLYCSFDLSKLQKMEDLRLFLGVASVSTIIVAFFGVAKAVEEAKK